MQKNGLSENFEEIEQNPIVKVVFQELEKIQHHRVKIHVTIVDVAKIKNIPKLAKDLFWQLKRNWNLSTNSSKNVEIQG